MTDNHLPRYAFLSDSKTFTPANTRRLHYTTDMLLTHHADNTLHTQVTKSTSQPPLLPAPHSEMTAPTLVHHTPPPDNTTVKKKKKAQPPPGSQKAPSTAYSAAGTPCTCLALAEAIGVLATLVEMQSQCFSICSTLLPSFLWVLWWT